MKIHLRSYIPPGYYDAWVQQHQQNPSFNPKPKELTNSPLISIIVPAYNTPKTLFNQLVYSIVSQSYPKWELIVINASSDKKSTEYIKACNKIDKRISVIDAENKGIATNTNLGIEAAHGTYIAFADHDDLLDPSALIEAAIAISTHKADLIYSDEDKITEDGKIYFDPHFKPDWSPDLFTHVNYITHLVVVKKELIERVGLLDPDKDGAQDYDLLLKITDLNPKIYHIPKILYHWRAAKNSTAQDFSSKTNVTKAGISALDAHFRRQKANVKVSTQENRPGFYTIQHEAPESITIIITPFGSDSLLRLYTELLVLKTNLDKVHLELIVPEGATPRKPIKNCVIKTLPPTPNFLQEAVALTSQESVIIISSIILPVKNNWLEDISGLLQLRHIGAVTPLIVRHDSIIEDCGVVRLADGSLSPLFRGTTYKSNQTFFGNTDWVRNVDALSGAFVLTRKNDLNDYLAHNHHEQNFQKQLQGFSTSLETFKTVYTEVLFDTHSINLSPAFSQISSFFNPNLELGNEGFELYTPEAAAIHVLLHQREIEEGRVL